MAAEPAWETKHTSHIPAFRSGLSGTRRQKNVSLLPLIAVLSIQGWLQRSSWPAAPSSTPADASSLPGSHLFPSLGFWVSYHFSELVFCSVTFLSCLSYPESVSPVSIQESQRCRAVRKHKTMLSVLKWMVPSVFSGRSEKRKVQPDCKLPNGRAPSVTC